MTAGRVRPLDSGRKDVLGRTVRVSGQVAETRADAPAPSQDAVRCGRCGQFAGGVHRCPAPGLVDVDDGLRRVLGAVSAAGGRPMLVGGCVRDGLLEVSSKDVDVEVYGRSLAELEVGLVEAGCRVDAVGAQFGVLKVQSDGGEFDVSVPRRDSKTGVGHRGFDVEVDHTISEVEATARRDFTVNALMWDPVSGEIVDCHQGLADLERRVLRHTSPAFAEDPLRVLRGVQFAGRFGMRFDEGTVELCRSMVDEFGLLPRERVWGEWSKIASKAVVPSRSLAALVETGWVGHHPELVGIQGVAQDARWHPEGAVDVHTGEAADAAASIAVRDGLDESDRQVLVFAAIAHDFGKATHTQFHADGRITSHGHAEAGVEPAGSFLASIGCPSRLVDRVTPLVAEHMCAATPDGPTPRAVRRLARRLGDVGVEQWARVVEADYRGRGVGSSDGPAGEWVVLARSLSVGSRPAEVLVSGRDLIAAGLRPGPEFKPLLLEAQAAQDDGLFVDREGALGWLRARLGD